jgi:hypothetical protein
VQMNKMATMTKQIVAKMIPKGNFKMLGMADYECEMLNDAYQAVSAANKWDFLARSDVPGEGGFMFSRWAELDEISKHMKYDGHSGGTYGLTMRMMQRIAIVGWDKYAEEQIEARKPAAALKIAKTLDDFLGANLDNPLDFAKAMQKDEAMRQKIPDIDEQVSALQEFAKGNMSYAEMRSRCG